MWWSCFDGPERGSRSVLQPQNWVHIITLLMDLQWLPAFGSSPFCWPTECQLDVLLSADLSCWSPSASCLLRCSHECRLFRHNHTESSLVPWWRNNFQSFIRAGTTLSTFKKVQRHSCSCSPNSISISFPFLYSPSLLFISLLFFPSPQFCSGRCLLFQVVDSHCFQLHSGLIMYLTIKCSGQKPLLKC